MIRFGIPDYRVKEDITIDGAFDYESDLRIAERLWEIYDRFPYAQFCKLVGQYTCEEKGIEVNLAYKKFIERHKKIAKETHLLHGEKILERVNIPFNKGIILEAGCGNGQYIYGFSRCFKEVYVVDISLVNLLMAMRLTDKYNLSNVLFTCANLERLPFEDNRFDFIHCNGVIEHTTHPEKVVREVYRTLKEGGVYLLLSPNKYTLGVKSHHHGTPRLLSLFELRQLLKPFRDCQIIFLPKLKSTTRQTILRRWAVKVFAIPVIGDIFLFLINRIFLPVMPYHMAVCRKAVKE